MEICKSRDFHLIETVAELLAGRILGAGPAAQTFDVASRRMTGDPIRIAGGVVDQFGYPLFAASESVLGYLSRPLARLT